MRTRSHFVVCLLAIAHGLNALACQDAANTAAAPQAKPADTRLTKYRNIYDKLHPWSPPATREQWNTDRQKIRERVLISNGLWPLPAKTKLQPQLGKIFQRDGYTVQHAMFASRPGHYVTGLIYKPTRATGKVPAILCPHGHWQNGRFYDAGDKKLQEQLDNKAETLREAARYPLQARFVQLARMGCLVFHYDMIGYADSTAIDHRKEFNDAKSLLWLNNKMGLQTWNSIRALDFVTELPDVDANKLAVTGGSGGGTQSLILAAVDDRLAAAFPAVMTSTNMQGGCVCENASYLRIGINNVALAAAFAPKPMAMSGADDWTIDIERLGLPELRQVWSFYEKPSLVNAKAWPQYKHNYNSHARQMMYEWFNEHLNLNIDDEIKESTFKPLSREELTVFGSIKKPADIKTAESLRTDLRTTAAAQFLALQDNPQQYRKVVGTAADVMFGHGSGSTRVAKSMPTEHAGLARVQMESTDLPNAAVRQYDVAMPVGGTKQPVVLWVDESGIDTLLGSDEFRQLVADNSRFRMATANLFATGNSAADFAEIRGEVDKNYGGLTYCYNLPLLSERVRDLARCIELLNQQNTGVTLVGTGSAGPIALMAAAICESKVNRVIVDLNGFSFASVKNSGSDMMLPGALRYGDIGGIAALALPAELTIYGTEGVPAEALAPLRNMAKLTSAKVSFKQEPLTRAMVVEELK